MTQLVEDLDDSHRQSVGDHAGQADHIDEGSREKLPRATDVDQSENSGRQGQKEKTSAEEPIQTLDVTAQPSIRLDQRNPEKKVVVQQPLPKRSLAQPKPVRHLMGYPGPNLQKLMALQKNQHPLDIRGRCAQSRRRVKRIEDRIGVIQRPAAQDFKAEPVDLEELIANRIMEHPARLSVIESRPGKQRNLLAQRGETDVRHQIARYCRMTARGRRTSQ